MLSFFPRGVLDEILNLIESVSEGFPSNSWIKREVPNISFLFSAIPEDMHSQQQSIYSKNVKISSELTSSSQKQGLYQIRKSQFHV